MGRHGGRRFPRLRRRGGDPQGVIDDAVSRFDRAGDGDQDGAAGPHREPGGSGGHRRSRSPGARGGFPRLDDDTAELPFRISDLGATTVPPYVSPSATPHVWLSDPMDEHGPDLLTRLAERRLEIGALLALSVGTLLLSFVGLVVGWGLVALSRFWELRDKLLAMLVLPGTTLFGGIVLSWLRATRIDPVADAGLRLGRAVDGITMTVLALPLMVGWLSATYLGYLVIRNADAAP